MDSNNSKNLLSGIKIALGYEIKDGPWGGANLFLQSFKNYFENKGAKVVQQLEDGLDIIIIINPRSGTFSLNDIKRYKKRHPKVKVIHRINETDKAKNTKYYVERLRFKANRISNFIVFISQWLRDYYIERGFDVRAPHAVVRNSVNKEIFNANGNVPWEQGIPMRIVTHHWSRNLMKGVDIYKEFDDLLDDPWMRNRFQFTYMGRLPLGIELRNTCYIPPLSGKDLATELKKHHVYLTAARWEACGMHQLEGACCGLPVLYIDEGGGMVECCEGFGIKFTKKTFIASLFRMLEEYEMLQLKMKDFDFDTNTANKTYEKIIIGLLNE